MKKSALFLVLLAALFATACGAAATVDQATGDQASGDQATAEETTVDQADSAPAESSDSPVVADEQEQPEAAAEAETADDAEPGAETAGAAAESETEEATEPAAETAEAAEPAAEAEEALDTVDTTSAAALLGSDDWCTAANQIENTLGVDDDIAILSDPAALEDAYTQAGRLMNEAVRIAPPAIAPDVAQMAESFVLFTAVLDDAEWDFLGVDLSAMEAVASEMEVAGYNIEKYNFEVCGIGEDPGSAPIIGSDEFDEPLPSGSPRDLMVESFMSGGFSEAEALCLVDEIDFLNPEVMSDPAAMLDAFGECGISLDRLSNLGG